MKGQQLFHCFLPGVTVAILTTQPTVAHSITVSGIKPTHSPDMVVSTNGGNLSTHIGLPFTSKITTNPALGFDHDLSSVVADQHNSLPVIIAARNTNVNSVKVRIDNNNKVVNVANNSNNDCSLSPGKNQGFIDYIRSISPVCHGQKSVPSWISQVTDTTNQDTVTPNTQESEKIPETVVPTNISSPNSPQPSDNSQQQPVVIPVNNQSQKTPVAIPVNNQSQKTPVAIPVNNQSQKTPDDSQQKPETANSSQVPSNLDPSPNPLLFPTKDEEVKIQGEQRLTLEQVLELARRNNNDLQLALLQLGKSQSVLKEAQAALLPSVDLSASLANSRSASSSLQYDQAKNTNPLAGDAPSSTDFTGRAQLTYNLYTSGKRNAVIQEAEERIKVQELEVERQLEEIRLNVSKAYYDLQQADEQLRISEAAVKNAEASLKDANALERAGVGTKFDVLRSQVNLANAKQDLTNAIKDQQITQRRLAPLLNLPQYVTITAADPVKLAGLWQHSLEKSIVLAYQNRPELQQNLAQRNIGEAQRKQAISALGPQVSLIARYDVLDELNDNTSISDGYSLGVQATLSLYDGGSAKAKAAQAKSDIAIAETKFSDQRNQIRFQVEQAYSTQESSLKNVQTATAALEQARESLRLARLRFQAGVGTQTDVINAENDLTKSEGNLVKAKLDYNRALTELQRYVTLRGLKSVSK